ncbi:MAG: NUDIX hydrolase [Salinibacterium sp.]|nr:NUDIX hydrolase [Salinibacterium sp.]
MLPPVVAAGALCWRVVDGKVRVLVVHRAAYGDVSFPKGKVESRETLPEAAVRELREETGLSVVLGAPLGVVEYVMPNGRDKVVHYWTAEIKTHELELARFTPNDEIAALEWLTISEARKRLSYSHDVGILEAFTSRFKAGNARTFAVITVRHGKAMPPGSWDGPDSTRPLMRRGSDQAIAIVNGISAFGPLKIISSTAVRCVATVEPLSRLTALPIKTTAAISQDAFEHGLSDVTAILAKRLKQQASVVFCSHGPVIPQIVDELARRTETELTNSLRRCGELDTGQFSVFHVSTRNPRSGLVGVEVHAPALA